MRERVGKLFQSLVGVICSPQYSYSEFLTDVIIHSLREFEPQERNLIFEEVAFHYCIHCGIDQQHGKRACQCWNDE